MRRQKLFESCPRATVPRRIKAEVIVRQEGRCADCRTRLDLSRTVFDHRLPLALRAPEGDPNDPDRLAAICSRCDRLKTRRDLVEIARTKRMAFEEADHRQRMADKVCGRPRLSRRAERELDRLLDRASRHSSAVNDERTIQPTSAAAD
jgi:hypothetical protein